MKLGVGGLDKVQTAPDALPAMKGVLFTILEPRDKEKEIVEYKEGTIRNLQYTVRVTGETPYTVQTEKGEMIQRNAENRVLSIRAWIGIDKDEYLSWKGTTEADYEAQKFLADLKRLGTAIGIDFETQDVEEAYGKQFRGDITQRTIEDGRVFNEVKNPKLLVTVGA